MRAPLVVGVLGFAGGIAAGAYGSVPARGGPFFVTLALAGAVAAAVLARPGCRRTDGRPLLALLVLAGALLGTAARSAAERSCAGRLPPGVSMTVHGRVLDRAGDRVTLRLDSVEAGGVGYPCDGPMGARLEGRGPPPGAAVVGQGRWWRPPGGGSRVAVRGLLILDGLEPAGGPERASTRARPWGRWLSYGRESARARVDAMFGERAALAASLLLAQRDGLDPDVRDRFARAGLSHLLAISGLHVALVAGILLILAGAARLGKSAAAAVAGSATLAYVLFLGAPHSAARAALQILLVLGARAIQRPARTEALIAAAALVLLAAEPAALFSPGFQLSFAGVAGILAIRRPLLRALRPVAGVGAGGPPVGRWLADGLATSVAATLATAPIVAWHFGRVAPIGIVANLVAIPLLSAAVPALALALGAGVMSLTAGRFLAGAGTVLLDGLDATARIAASVPGATMAVAPSTAGVLTAAVGLGYAASRRLGRVRRPVRLAVWGAMASVVLVVAPLRPLADRVEIHVIDVGQGDAIAVRSPAGRWLLVDAGLATDGYDAGARQVVPYLGRRGVQRLEGLVVTHPDADHMGGAASVIRALRPRWVADPGIPAPKPAYLALLQAAAARGAPWVALRQGLELEVDGMRLQVLHPVPGAHAPDVNDASVVLRLVFGEFQALLTGDASTEVEAGLVQRYGRGLEADVLKVGHHGSATSTGEALLAATGARTAVISVGRGNRYGHPHRSVVQRLRAAGMEVVRTDRHGSLVVRGTSTGVVVIETERDAIPP